MCLELFCKGLCTAAFPPFVLLFIHLIIYRIYSINRPERLLKLLDLESGRLFGVGAYSRLGPY